MSHAATVWQRVLSDTTLVDHAAAIDGRDVASVASLRKQYSAEEVSVALELAGARAKAIHKFGERGGSLVADVQGVEQASGAGVAAYKAKRFRDALADAQPVIDACCGIGGDSMALSGQGLTVHAVDRDPLRAWMAQENCNGQTRAICADVAELDVEGAALHIDPARRDESARRRAWRLEDYQPGPAVIGRLIASASMSAVKLSPGVDVDVLPWPGELEFISERGRLVQAVLWGGVLAQADRRATLVRGEQIEVLSGKPFAPFYDSAKRYLYTVDAAVERADLLGQLCEAVDAPMLHPSLGLVTADRLIDSPWLTGFELIQRMPWRPKRVAAWLKANDGGLVEIKTRGKACDPDIEQRKLRNAGSTTYTVFVLRFDTRVEALVTKRLVLK